MIQEENKQYLAENPKSIIVAPLGIPSVNQGYRDLITGVEDRLVNGAGSVFADFFPLKHSFADGVYMREFFSPKGYFMVTKLHREAYISWLVNGEVTVMTEQGGVKMKGPRIINSPAGAKRIIYAHEDFTWITVHPNPTNSTNIEELEARIHVDGGYDELDKVIDLNPDKTVAETIDIDAFLEEFRERIIIKNKEELCQDYQ